MTMSAARFRQLISAATTTAVKVYDSVPMNEDWTVPQIIGDLTRRGISLAPNVIQGCLDSLRRQDLVKEDRGSFRRVPVRASTKKIVLSELKEAFTQSQPQQEPIMNESVLKAPPKAAPKVNIVDAIGNLAQRLNAMALRHKQEMEELAHLISDAAIDVQSELEMAQESMQSLNQLRTLLKNI